MVFWLIKMELRKLTVKKLRELCKKNGIKGYSKLRKNELIELIQFPGPPRTRTQSPLPRMIKLKNNKKK